MGHFMIDQCAALMTARQVPSKFKRDWNAQCDHCKMMGHTKANCYRLIGYLSNFRFKKKNRSHAHNVRDEESRSHNDGSQARAAHVNFPNDPGYNNYSRADNLHADWNRSHIPSHQHPQMMQQYNKSSHLNQSNLGKHKADDVPESSSSNMCRLSDSNMGVILVYVDDMLIAGNDLVLIEHTKQELHARFKIKDLGILRYFLGIEFGTSDKGILMNQRKYALELIEEMGLVAAKPSWTPLDINLKLTNTLLDKAMNITHDQVLADKDPYQRLIGRLLYLTLTRPDIGFAVQILSQFLQCPKKSHMEAALKVVRYIKKTCNGSFDEQQERQGINWAACPNTRRSVTGFLIKHGESLISWKSKKQTTVSRSLAESKYRSMASTISEL
uniref:Reverse transcriptase Ty1/copia-type domain-containing protein n=1 Tax=Solanum lycopersicum TaxID=4081 RepID=A0A3Q7GUG7_SOLLC